MQKDTEYVFYGTEIMRCKDDANISVIVNGKDKTLLATAMAVINEYSIIEIKSFMAMDGTETLRPMVIAALLREFPGYHVKGHERQFMSECQSKLEDHQVSNIIQVICDDYERASKLCLRNSSTTFGHEFESELSKKVMVELLEEGFEFDMYPTRRFPNCTTVLVRVR